MTPDIKTLLRLILSIVFLIGNVEACGVSPAAPAGATKITVNSTLAVYFCGTSNAVQLFTSGSTVILSRCIGSAWQPVTGTCPTTIGGTAAAACSGAFNPPPNAEKGVSEMPTYYTVVKCIAPKRWLSGVEDQISQCDGGTWEEVLDICDVECPIPRDCHDVANLGLMESGNYYVIPSGKSTGEIYEVSCLLADTPYNSGGHWTVVLNNTIGTVLNGDTASYTTGVTTSSATTSTFFEGLYFLGNISLPTEHRTEIGSVLQVVFIQSSVVAFHATYSNFTVGPPPDFKVLSLGTYHGNAGNGMCPYVGSPFSFSSTTPAAMWWQRDSTLLCADSITSFPTMNSDWVSELNSTQYASIEMRIRPASYDRANFCPPILGASHSWSHTTSTNISFSRSPGSQITFRCEKLLFYGGLSDPLSYEDEGNATCLKTLPPTWNVNLHLPCQLRCPSGYIESSTKDRCFHFSTATASGFLDAANQCQGLNGTLAHLQRPKLDMEKSVAGTFYYVNHVNRSTQQTDMTLPYPNAASNDQLLCEINCDNTPPYKCMVADSTKFKYSDCNTAYNFMCELPAVCPDGYDNPEGTGACFKALGPPARGVNMPADYAECVMDGASLAYPETNEEFRVLWQYGMEYLLEFVSDPVVNISFGTNKRSAEWTTAEVISGQNEQNQFLMMKVNSSAYEIMAIPENDPTITVIPICQYPGFIDCSSSSPPIPLEAMDRDWTKENFTFYDPMYQIDYMCDRGYFVDGNITLVNQSVSCRGMLGGWQPPTLLPCVRVEVCKSSLITVPAGVSNVTTPDSYYLDGFLAYNCPIKMGFPSGNSSINATCSLVSDPATYAFLPDVIEQCNVCVETLSFQNATTNWVNTSSFSIGTTMWVECNPGYEFALINKTTQLFNCTPAGYDLSSIQPCYPVCSGTIPLYPKNITNNNIGFIINESCPAGTYYMPTELYPALVSTTSIVCNGSGYWVAEREEETYECYALCTTNPQTAPANVSSTWDGFSRFLNETVTYTTSGSYYFANFSQTVTVVCSNETGTPTWTPALTAAFLTAKEACLTTPASTVGDAVLSTATPVWAGSSLVYWCPNGTANADGNVSFSLMCFSNGSYATTPTDFLCEPVCPNAPPTAPAMATSDFVGDLRLDVTVTYTCSDANHYFGNFSPTVTTTCSNETGTLSWNPTLNSSLLMCQKACLTTPASTVGDAVLSTATPVWAGSSLVYWCPNGTANADGNVSFSLMCFSNGSYATTPTDFLCETACYGPPPAVPTLATSNFTGDIRVGVTVMYTCAGGFDLFFEKVLYTTCSENHTWEGVDVPKCLPVTTPGPSTVKPEVLSPFPEDQYYQYTTDYHFPSLGEFSDVNGVVNNYQVVNGPFGFGTAVEVNSTKSQCLKKEKFVPDYETCIRNPNQCPDGLSFSIWEKPQFYVELLESVSASTAIEDPTKYRYVVSTGGDDQGHPGFAIMHMDHWIIAVVCTGERAWKAKALGHVRPLVWNNIGITWKNTEGLKLFVNGTQRGSDDAGRPVATQLPLSPAELMIGCHKDSSNANYRGFIDAFVDEFAIWGRELNSTDVPLFKGGYAEELANMTSEDLASKINRVDMTDPDQVNSAILFLTYLSNTAATPTSATPTAAASTAQSPTATSAATTSASPTVDSGAVKDLENLEKVFSAIINVDKMAESYTSNNLKMTRKMVTALSSLVKPENAQTWLHIQKDPNEGGEMSLLDGYFEYSRKLMQRTVYDNISVPYCFEENLDHLTDEMCKARLSDMKERGSWVQKPNQYNPRYADEWSGPYDRAAVNLNVFSDERCLERPINTHSTVFNSASKAAQTRVNPSVIDANKRHVVDSRLLYFHLLADLARDGNGKIDTSQPLCQPDNDLMVKSPLRIKLEHNNKVISLRKLEFHENETTSDITVRRCVWWNRNLSDFGAWDSTGCVVEATSEVYTKCLCDKFGLFAILAEKAEPIEVPEEPSWLTYIKYALYGLSALAITLYIIVVAISGDLKDQFHLMGVNLAVAILVGSAAIVVSDFEDIRADRHSNVAIGALIHFFYGAVGSWIYALGHGSFRAITSGVIGGRLQSYMFICWGMALACMGIPFVGALHELGTDPRCFISWNDNIKYVFFLPQIFYCGGGLFFAIVILCNLSTPALRKENLIEDYGSFCRGAAVLLILLSLTWVFGLLAFVRFNLGTDFNPIFQVLNSMAGLALFFLIGIGSNRFRMFLAGQAKTRRQMLKAYAFGLPGAKKDDIPSNAATDATQKASSNAKDKK